MKKQSGFTIIELLVSLTLIAILSLVSCPAIYHAINIFTDNERKTYLAIYTNDIIEYYKLNINEVKQLYENRSNPEQDFAEYKISFKDIDDLKNKLKNTSLQVPDAGAEDSGCIFDCFIKISTKALYKNNTEVTLENVKVYEIIIKISYKMKANCYVERAGIFFTSA